MGETLAARPSTSHARVPFCLRKTPCLTLGMIEELRLENFRGFDDHRLPLTDLTLLVGRNNAGKSTIVEAMRLLAAVTSRTRGRAVRFVRQPGWVEDPRAWWGDRTWSAPPCRPSAWA